MGSCPDTDIDPKTFTPHKAADQKKKKPIKLKIISSTVKKKHTTLSQNSKFHLNL